MATSGATNLNQQLRSLWKQWFTLRSTNPDEAFRERTIRGTILILFIFACATSIVYIAIGAIPRLALPFGMIVLVAVSTWAVNKGRIHPAGWAIVALGIFAEVSSLFQVGYWQPGVLVAAIVTLLCAAILLPPRSTRVIPYILIGILIGGSFWLQAQGVRSPLPADNPFATPVSAIVASTCIILLVVGIYSYLINEFNRQRIQLKQLIGSLEERVTARTRDLTIAAKVSQQITQVLDLVDLLPELTELTRTSFNLSHVSIFLLDDDKKTLRLQAGTGSAGQQMVKQQKKFRLDEHGLVPLSARQQQPQVINDVQQSADYAVNPFLPTTRSEVALPMVIGGAVIGVLDMQSDQVNKFSPDDIKVLTSLGEQIAVAVRNANLFTQAREATQEAEQANRVKSQFLASMSHELRTPLNAILNFSQFVSSGMCGPVNDDQVDLLDKVVHSGRHLLSLINDVLDISKIESGALKLFVEDDANCADEAKSVASMAQTLLHNKPVQLEVTIADNVPFIIGDKRRIRQIMLNLVSNACKFTDNGQVHIDLKSQGDSVCFTVGDTGPGIAQEDAEMVFEAFHQSTTGLRQGEGTGLGLPISRRLAEAHGGRLWFESTPGQGTTFYVTLPIRSAMLVPMLAEREANHAQ